MTATTTILPDKTTVLNELRDRKKLVHEKYKIILLGLFGSVARGEQHSGSDLDILIRLEKGASIMDWSALRLDLMDVFGCEVNLTDSQNIREGYKPAIYKDLILI